MVAHDVLTRMRRSTPVDATGADACWGENVGEVRAKSEREASVMPSHAEAQDERACPGDACTCDICERARAGAPWEALLAASSWVAANEACEQRKTGKRGREEGGPGESSKRVRR